LQLRARAGSKFAVVDRRHGYYLDLRTVGDRRRPPYRPKATDRLVQKLTRMGDSVAIPPGNAYRSQLNALKVIEKQRPLDRRR
jgi:hypothetical protein